MAILLVVVNIADALSQSGMGTALIQKTEVDDKSYSTAFWTSLGISLLMFALIYFLAPVLSSFYNMPAMEAYIRILGFVVIVNSVASIQRSYLQRRMRFDKLFKSNLAAVIISGIIGVVLALSEAGVWALVCQALAQSVLCMLFMAVMVPWHPSFCFSRKEALSLFSYGWKICITGILNVLYNGVTELVIGKTCSSTQLGLYSQGRKYPLVATNVITNAISNVLFPALSKVKDEKDLFIESIKKTLSIGMFIVAPVSLFFVVAAKPVVVLLLTEKWSAAVPVFQLFFLCNSVLMFQLVNLRAYMALGDSALYMKINIVKILIGGTILCCVALATANIYSTALAACIVTILGVFFVDMPPARKLMGYGCIQQVKDQLPTLLCVAMAGVLTFLISYIELSTPALLILQILVFFGVYLVLAKVFKCEGLDLLCSVLKKK